MSERLSRPPGLPLVGLLAMSAGATVANLYYSQPILGTIARQFGVSTSAASQIVTLTRLGYRAGWHASVVDAGFSPERGLILERFR
jgi:predicted MFS family arabinose efflux permease